MSAHITHYTDQHRTGFGISNWRQYFDCGGPYKLITSRDLENI